MVKVSERTVGRKIRMSGDRKSTRLNSSHSQISYAVFCLKKKMSVQTLASERPAQWVKWSYAVWELQVYVVNAGSQHAGGVDQDTYTERQDGVEQRAVIV